MKKQCISCLRPISGKGATGLCRSCVQVGNQKGSGKIHSQETLIKMSEARKKWNEKHPGYWAGENNPKWSGGLTHRKDGYVLQRTEIGKRNLIHRLIARGILKRPLKENEVVHHINGNRSDNNHNNLLICTTAYHSWLHDQKKERNESGKFIKQVAGQGSAAPDQAR